jgi:hypothetical protein
MSPEELAAELGLSKPSYYNRISGDHEWKLSELVKLAELMNQVSQGETIEVKSGTDAYSIHIEKI